MADALYFCFYIIPQSVAADTETTLAGQIAHYLKESCVHKETVGGVTVFCFKPVRCDLSKENAV